MSTGLRYWPRRRWLLAAAAFPVLAVAFAAVSGGALTSAASWWIWPWLILNGALASVVVASYLAQPGTGKLIDVGCSPCAAVAGLALVGSLMVHSNAPASPFMTVVATALTAFALRQRLTDVNSCQAPAGPRAAASATPRPAIPDPRPVDSEPPAATSSAGVRAS